MFITQNIYTRTILCKLSIIAKKGFKIFKEIERKKLNSLFWDLPHYACTTVAIRPLPHGKLGSNDITSYHCHAIPSI